MCKKLVNLHQVWRDLKKKKCKENTSKQQQEFTENLDNLYDITHANDLQLMKYFKSIRESKVELVILLEWIINCQTKKKRRYKEQLKKKIDE